ncbi:PEP-CTERM sorting domain-containing protein [Duganella sp. P38]|uniref:PEP-CTERM sorting domain-containing protein n=1 Tax=Duganella sp. P38 TaxID=3423949 RepID=UPI003D7A4D26
MKRIILAGVIAVAAISSAHAASITGLNNTGLGASGSGDSNYKLSAASSDTGITSTVPVITYDKDWPINPWMANNSTSRWITPTASQGQSLDAWSAGTYTYTLSFNLAGYDASTASFAGRMAADNAVTVKLNNQIIGGGASFSDWASFSANSGFVAGVNTVDFIVTNWAQNGGNPTGLRVEFGSSSVTAVPEPETYAMLLGGLGLVGLLPRRRKLRGQV